MAGLTAAAESTLRAVEQRSPVVYQAAMFDGRFVGFADFLLLDGDRYRLRDTKLARSVKVEALLQLAAYAETLATAGVGVHDEVELVLGDGTTMAYRADELLPVYRSRRAELQDLLDRHYAGGAAVSWADDTVRACMRCPECEIQVRAHDDLLLVANMRVTQRARLIDAGITTLTELAHHDGPVPGLSARTATALNRQAALQITPRADGRPPYEVVDAQPLMLLPDPDKGDLFFDFEGDPLWTADGREWGLEYLFGVLGAKDDFTPLWAHDRAAERTALVDFLAMVRKRRKRHPRMHIYHYAAYEKTALLRLAGRYGVGEDEVDDLLRDGVLVDLFPWCARAFGSAPRTTASSRSNRCTWARNCAPVTSPRPPTRSPCMPGTPSCAPRAATTRRPTCSRRSRTTTATTAGPPAGCGTGCWAAPSSAGAAVGTAAGPRHRPGRGGRRRGPDTGPFRRRRRRRPHPEQRAVAMIAAARGYHRREDKPFWWGHFDRLNSPVDEWGDTPGFPGRRGHRRRRLARAAGCQEAAALGAADRLPGRR